MRLHSLKFHIVLLIAVMFSVTSVYADALNVAYKIGEPAESFKVDTPDYTPQFASFEPPLGRYEYTVSWQGIPAATVYVDLEQDSMQYNVQTLVKTYKAIDIFYRLRYRAGASISVIDFQPFSSFFEAQENSRMKRSELEFFPDGSISSYYLRKDREPRRVEFNPHNNTLDPFSAAFLARSLDWNEGDSKVFDTYNGKSRYLIEMKVVDTTTLEVNGVERPVWVISPKVKKLGAKTNDKLREARIYLTTDKSREILQITSEVFVGTVKTRLSSFQPSTSPPAGTAIAALSGKVFVK